MSNNIPRRKGSDFRCNICKETFEYPDSDKWSEEDAIKEYQNNFPETQHHKDLAVLCDDCYNEFNKWFNSLPSHVRDKLKKEAAEYEP